MSEQRRQPRKYTGPTQHFHNFEHDPSGLNHCKSEGQHPYEIEHVDGKHKISAQVAIGHGKGNKPQAFEFTEKLGDGWDLASGKPIELMKEKAPKPTKEPWQMTKEEFDVWKKEQSSLKTEEWNKAGSKGFPPGLRIDTVAKRTALAEKAGYVLPRDANIVIGMKYHKLVVEAALASGKPVPAEVLKDYPELKAELKAEKSTPKEEHPVQPQYPWKIIETVRGSHNGQMDITLIAKNESGGLGKLDYAQSGDIILIQHIEVPEVNRRHGIAKSLVERLHADNPKAEIKWGMLTEAGAKLKQSLSIDKASSKPQPEAMQEMPKDKGKSSTYVIDDTRSPHAIRIDQGIQAKDVVTNRNKEGVSRWREHPNQMDIRGIDTLRTKAPRFKGGRVVIDTRGHKHRQKRGSVL